MSVQLPSSPLRPTLIPLNGDNEPVPMLSLVNSVLRHRVLVILIVVVITTVAVFLRLTAPPTFTSTLSFIPQGRQGQSGLTGLAAQFAAQAVAAGGADFSRSPAFYADLVSTRQVLDPLSKQTYAFQADTGAFKGTLIDFYGEDGSPGRRRENTFIALRKSVSASVVQRTGVVEVLVTTESPELSLQIANGMLGELTRFNVETRQSQAGAERRFTERQLLEARDSLRAAENTLLAFLQANRDYSRAPSLQFQHERLSREVAFRQQLYASLGQAAGQARIDEVRDTPVFTIIDRPEAAVRRNPRGVVMRALIMMFASTILGVIIAILLDRFGSLQTRGGDMYDEFAGLRRATIDDLLHPWRPLARGAGRLRRPSGNAPS